MQRLSEWLAARRLAVDVASVVLLGPPVVLVTFDFTTGPMAGLTPWWAVAVIVPLAARRRWPAVSAVAVFSLSAAQILFGPWLLIPANLAVLVSLYSVTVYGPRWAGRTAMGGIVAGAALFGAQVVLGLGIGSLRQASVFSGLILITGLAVWALAMLRRARQETLDALRDRAERLERERDQQAQIAAAAERARIAREMHDIVAHSLSIVVAQADGGQYAARHDPQAAVTVLGTISDTGRAALADVRRILGVLRDGPTIDPATTPPTGAGPVAGPVAPLAPQPAAGDVDRLLDGVRGAGVEVSLQDVGVPTPLPPGLELTVYRVLQEALTNVLKHAGPEPRVVVERHWGAGSLVVEVTDDGRGAAAAGPEVGGGHGLAGMRERVALYDGEVRAGPRPGGGFAVRVQLPLATDRAAIPDGAADPGPAWS